MWFLQERRPIIKAEPSDLADLQREVLAGVTYVNAGVKKLADLGIETRMDIAYVWRPVLHKLIGEVQFAATHKKLEEQK